MSMISCWSNWRSQLSLMVNIMNYWASNWKFTFPKWLNLHFCFFFSEFVKPICLPRGDKFSEKLVKEQMILSGWGSINGSDPMQGSKDLLYITVPVLDFETCKKTFSYAQGDSQICLGHSEKGEKISRASRYEFYIHFPTLYNSNHHDCVIQSSKSI